MPRQESLALVGKGQHVRRGRRKNKKSSKSGAGNLTSGGGGGVSTVVYEPWMPLFPASTTKRLRYSTTFALTSTSGVISSTQVFRANDLFDPDFTGTGHQPMGFDQLMVFYNHFCVVKAKIIIQAKNTTDAFPTVCARIDADSTPITSIDRIVEFGGCVTENLDTKLGYGATKKLQLSVDIAKLQGVKLAAITADDSLRGTAAASPAEVSYFHITLWNTSGTTSSAQFDITLEQTAIFLEPRDISASFQEHKTAATVKPPNRPIR